jgi:transcription initiation factor TFIID TATA-box-binding protein
MNIEVENLVYTSNLSSKLNLRFISSRSNGRNGFNPKKFAAVIQRTTDPKIAVLMFSPGKLVCTGAKTQNQAIRAINDVVECLKVIGYASIYVMNFKSENTVCSARLGMGIDCKTLAAERSNECTYDPDNFPGVIMRYAPIRPVTVLIFKSGKMVLTGAKSEQQARTHFDTIFSVIEKYIIKDPLKERETLFQNRTVVINEMIKEQENNKRIKLECAKEEIVHVKDEIVDPDFLMMNQDFFSAPKKSSVVERKYNIAPVIKRSNPAPKIKQELDDPGECTVCYKHCSRRESDAYLKNICCVCATGEDGLAVAHKTGKLCNWCDKAYLFSL